MGHVTDHHRQRLFRVIISTMTLMFFLLTWLIAGTLVAPHCSIDAVVYRTLCFFRMGDLASAAAAGTSWAFLWHLLDFLQVGGRPMSRILGPFASYGVVYAVWVSAALLVTFSAAGPYPLPASGDLFNPDWINDPLLDGTQSIFLP
jgi:hypothetical protein